MRKVEEKDYSSSPKAPFTTSTLQQEAGRKLGMTAIANSRMEVENIYKHTLAVLDRETSVGHRAEETLPE